MGEPQLRGKYHAGKPLAHRTGTPKKNLFGPAATRSFQTKQLLFTRGFLSVRVALASAPGPHASCRAAQHGACRWLVSHGIRAPSGHSHCDQGAAATPWMLSARLNKAEDEAEGGPICMRCSSYEECDGHGLLLSDLLALPAAASARTSTCSVLNVKTVVTASINTRPQDGCWSPAHAFQMVAAAVAYLLRSVDVGAQAPTQFPVKMAARPSCSARCARWPEGILTGNGVGA